MNDLPTMPRTLGYDYHLDLTAFREACRHTRMYLVLALDALAENMPDVAQRRIQDAKAWQAYATVIGVDYRPTIQAYDLRNGDDLSLGEGEWVIVDRTDWCNHQPGDDPDTVHVRTIDGDHLAFYPYDEVVVRCRRCVDCGRPVVSGGDTCPEHTLVDPPDEFAVIGDEDAA